MAAKGERTREAILDASYALFAEKGFKQVTMKDVCEAANMSRGGLYSHFSGTDQLFEALLGKITQEQSIDINTAIDEGMSAVTILNRILKVMEEEMKHPEDSLSIAMYEYAETVDSHVMEDLNRIGEKKWKKLIRYGIERGEFLDVDIDGVVNTIMYSYQGARMWSRIITMKPGVFRSITENLRKQLIKGGQV